MIATSDVVRRMDWNLTARSGYPPVRTTSAERELEVWLVVNGSASLDVGTPACESGTSPWLRPLPSRS